MTEEKIKCNECGKYFTVEEYKEAEQFLSEVEK
jgi:hypothetical protein